MEHSSITPMGRGELTGRFLRGLWTPRGERLTRQLLLFLGAFLGVVLLIAVIGALIMTVF